ncbi:hypothetical protein [Bacillus badius]|uniref:Uncharacterized protein n=1 Tax=Bacillus badius TaxID=1455 RepID=A0ABR5AR04_BACBA|nr:hypothetical protein [Bacillus badius]KIL77185.1 hypothetical protein SD77_1632 [Bacillus badius]KZO01033.1 hypothetical protein A4244_13440 [Bacillus badius]MED0668032.1 hypothetical protein [Bacillus badius]MED4717554.1 hypothetical protein [Bacillus badius]OCS89084.1 hypothetical protein A6M11_13460 [Bacillus badius]
MKITLAQAINLLSSLHKKVGELQGEFFNVHVIEVPKGETYTPYEITVEAVLQQLSEVQRDILELKEIIQQANLSNLVEWDGSSISMIRAIETAKQLRERLDLLKTLANTKKREYNVHHHSGAIMEQIALFDPAEFKKKADKLTRQVELLSSRIDKVNYTVEIEVPLANKYLEA